MTNYEAIKRMSQEEMATVFYMFMKPVFEVLKVDAANRQIVREQIKSFLSAEKAGQK